MARKQDWKESGYMEQALPPSKDERKQKATTMMVILLALAILGIGVTLRFTVFADRFRPTPFTPPVANTSPSPLPTASPEADPSS